MKKSLLLWAACAATFLFPQYLFAWGKTGHQIVAEIAMAHISESVKQKVQNCLGTTTPDEASVWMDEMRSNHDYDFMKPWHYVNVEKGKDYVPNNDENVVNQITIAINELKHKKTICSEQAKTDVMELFHLIGDLHQPLHAGYGADHGGNNVEVTFLSKPSNLHWVWDDEIIQQQKIATADVEKLYQTMSAEEIAKMKTIDVVRWMNESRALLGDVYNFQNNAIDEAYCTRNKTIIEKRLLQAGLRLGAVLEILFSDAAAVQQNTQVVAPGSNISAEEAMQHIGQEVTVCGKVFGGKFLEKSNGTPTLLNIGAAYPNSRFTVVIFGSDRGLFSYKPEEYLDGKNICITGKVKEYKGKAEIVVSKPEQIKFSDH
ncbi:S1/P1 nuclease [Taibaiella soli]|uniref:S1/P1 Nuclease n=1 Tax=Taibaiella soli TaxID=1649169 RepID=A0A2W2BE85_9BACT|nr:S1/P1 nuclease [Taibaiella soli]PZF74579.1 hypothetical protein DN068_03100 [Taibaiella soli]